MNQRDWKAGDEAITSEGERVTLVAVFPEMFVLDATGGKLWTVRLSDPKPGTSDWVRFRVWECNMRPVEQP